MFDLARLSVAVWLEQMGAVHSRKAAAPAPGQPWGFKGPRQLFMLPVLAEAYRRPAAIGPADTTVLLAVARDPRDICTGVNQVCG